MRRALRILILSSFFMNLAAGLFGPLYAVFVQRIGGDLLTAGSAYAAFSIALGAMIFLLSRWEDHVKHQERLVVIGRGLFAAGAFGYLFVRTPLDLLAVQILLGVAEAVTTPAFDSIFSRNVNRRKSASEWGTWEAMRAAVVGVAAIAGGYIANTYGFWLVFMGMGIFALLGLAASLLFFYHHRKQKSRLRKRKRRKKIR